MNSIKLLGAAVISVMNIASYSTAHAELADGKFGSAQVFDVQRNPTFPTAGNPITFSDFANPFADPGGQFSMVPGQYLKFFKVSDSPCRYGANLYNADNTVAGPYAASGIIWGLTSGGFLFTSLPGDFGTFIANGAGFSLGDSITLTPSTGEDSCAATAAYLPSTTPVSTAGPINPTPATPIPTLSEWAMITLTMLVAGFGTYQQRRRQL